MDGHAAVAGAQLAVLQPEADVARVEHVSAPVVLHGVALRRKLVAGCFVHLVQRLVNSGNVHCACRLGVPSLSQQDANAAPQRLHRPADGVSVHRLVHAELDVLAARPIDIALFTVEAVEPQRGGVTDLDKDGHSLV